MTYLSVCVILNFGVSMPEIKVKFKATARILIEQNGFILSQFQLSRYNFKMSRIANADIKHIAQQTMIRMRGSVSDA